MVALACWLLMPRFVQLGTLSSPSGLGTLKSLPIGFCVFRRMDTGDAMLEFGMSTIQECTSNNVKGEMHLLFMIGRNSCYSVIGWNLGFIRILIGLAHIRSFDQSQNVLDLDQDGLCLKGFLFLSTWSLLRRGAAK